jgi:hypothetical protein
MSILKTLLLVSVCTLSAARPPAPVKTPVAPLLPGEALALAGPDGVVYTFGDASREVPLGSLAELVWIKLEGLDWGSMSVAFNCTGMFKGHPCSNPKGHGRVDLAKALAENCDNAFLAWGQASVQWWMRDYGEGAARARLEDTFDPFLGNRMPPGEDLPDIEPPWIGQGDLLRTTPEAMLRWLIDPAQDETVRNVRRLLLTFKQYNYKDAVWWIHTGTAPEPGVPAATSAWAVGGNGQITAVLHLPKGKSKADGLARFRTIMMVAPDK